MGDKKYCQSHCDVIKWSGIKFYNVQTLALESPAGTKRAPKVYGGSVYPLISQAKGQRRKMTCWKW